MNTEAVVSSEKGGRIRILPPHLVNRIAAGEVVERPASVVKELVENALDAGATRIDVMASAAGRNIRVADNGCGMTPEDAAMAFYNHATSKIREVEDLDSIRTLGFRGEALASVGSISKLTCLTRTQEAPKGTKITLNEQGEPTLTEAGCAPGTIMEIADLFYNTPARLKFLKRAATEMGHIEETVQMLALSHPEVQFSLTLNERQALKTSGSGELKRTMDEIFNLKRENIPLVAITAADPEAGLVLAGFASEPGVMKSSKRWMMVYVNGRAVRCGIVQKAIEAAYESLLPHGKYPLAVLFLTLPPHEVDVNVHPTKREVRYAASNTIFGFVRSGIRESLSAQGISLDLPVDRPTEPNFAPVPVSSFSSASFSGPAHSGFSSGSTASGFHAGGSQAPMFSHREHLPVFRRTPDELTSQAALNFYQPIASENIATGEIETFPTPAERTSERFKVVGQLFNTYILLETPQGLMVVDQHIASERAFFEALTLNLTRETPDIQRMMAAHPLTVSPLQADLLARHQVDFAKLGFSYDLHETAVQLTGFPLIYAGRDGMFEAGGLFEDLLAQLEETGQMKPDLDHLIATLACHSAVRAGDVLTHFEMQAVIERWLACELPWTCPHGRPIAHTISRGELNKFFHRPSLPVNAG